MEMHHKLRRDPAWPASACNLCGQVGHQAAQCTNGTINWKGIYGEEAFILKEPLYHSDYTRMAEEKKVDLQDLEARATEFAKKACSTAGLDYEEVISQAVVWQALVTSGADGASAVKQDGDDVKPQTAQEPLPEGWAEAKDGQQRTYFWHTKTKKVQWERPTAQSVP